MAVIDRQQVIDGWGQLAIDETAPLLGAVGKI